MGNAALAKFAAANHPACRLAWFRTSHAEWRGTLDFELENGLAGFLEQIGQGEFFGRLAEMLCGLEGENAFGGSVEKAQTSFLIEGENGRIDLSDDAAKER